MEGKKLSADEALRILAGSEEAGTLLEATVGTSEGVGSRPASSAACAPRSPAGHERARERLLSAPSRP